MSRTPGFTRASINASQPSKNYLTISPGDTELENGPCRGLLCSEDGALDLTDTSGTVRTNIPVQKGYNPLVASVVDEPTSGSAPAIVVALY